MRPLLFLFAYLLLAASQSVAQSNTLISFSPDVTIMLNKLGNQVYWDDFLVDHAPSNLEFGISAQRRHFSRRGRPFSFEYGIRAHKSMTRLDVRHPDRGRSNLTLHSVGLGVPLRVFYDGFKRQTGLYKNQSGLYAEVLSTVNFQGDLAQNVYASHLSFGARTKGRVVYLQIAFGWPLYTNETAFTALQQGFIYTNRQRRFALLTLGYTLPQ